MQTPERVAQTIADLVARHPLSRSIGTA